MDNPFVQILEAGKDYPTVISFSSVNTPKGRFKPYRVVLNERCNVIFVNDEANYWYQNGIPGVSADTREAAAELVKTGRAIGNGRVVTFGTSMGAYGAALFAVLGRADGCLAFGIENVLGLKGTRSFMHLSRAASGKYPWLKPLLLENRVPIILYAPESDEVDLYHASQFCDLPHVEVITIQGCDHPGVQVFSADGGPAVLLENYAATLAPHIGFERQGNLMQHTALIPELWEAYQIKMVDKRKWLSFLLQLKRRWNYNSLVALRLGEAHYANSNGGDAEKEWRESVRLCRYQYSAHTKLGNLLRRRQGGQEEASHHFRRALEIYPRDAHALHGLGNVYFEQNDSAMAKQFFEKAFALNRGNKAFQESLNKV